MQPVNPIEHLTSQRRKRDLQVMLFLGFALIAIMLLSLSAGDMWISPLDWHSELAQIFVWQIRLPRALAVMLVGASLAVSGAMMQALFENPLAEPGLLGVSSGAGVVVVFIVLFYHGMPPLWVLSLGAISGALLLTLFLLYFAQQKKLSNSRVLLVGVALGVVCGAIMTWMVYFSSSIDLRQLMYWMMGSFSGVDWRQSALFIALFPIMLWAISQSRILNFLALGEVSAQQLGVKGHYWRSLFIIAVGLLVGISVAIAGAISFIGLVVPHILRLCGITDHQTLIPACLLTGASSLLIADLLSRMVLNSAEIPIGVITATLGAPIFIYLLIRQQGR